MESHQYNKISLNDISLYSDPFFIKNFILSNNIKNIPRPENEEPFIFDGIIFGLCIKGSGKIKINFREYKIVPESILVIIPNQIVKIMEKSPDFLMENLFFSFDFLAGLPFPKDLDILLNIEKQPCVKVSKETALDILEMHTFIVKQYNKTGHIYREKIARAQLYSLVLEIASIYHSHKLTENKTSSRKEELVNKFFKLLIENFRQERNVAFYADKLCLTSKYLSATIKNITGNSIHSWINEIVMIEAKLRLKTSDMTVLQISEELNFANPSFFGRFFKEHTGITPLKYRETE